MKNTPIAVAAALLAAVTFGAANDALVSFSTIGPDRYADGTTVLDGETYALVWEPAGSPGISFLADGSVENGVIVLRAPLARSGHCPRVVFEVEASRMEKEFVGGKWSVCLLDTRRWDASGTPKPTGTFSATPVVNAAGTVSSSGVRLSAGSPSGSSATAGGVAAIGSALPAGAPSPKVTGIKVANGYVYVTVKGTVPYVAYGLTESATPGGEGTQAAVQSGASTEDEEITFVAPAKSGGGFLKVGRK